MKIKCIGVLGFGTMGRQISLLCAERGFDVIATDIEENVLKKGYKEIEETLNRRVEKKKITKEKSSEILSRIELTTNFGKLCEKAHYIIEAIPESLDLKKKAFKDLDSKTDVILASNTSSLPITLLASETSKPERIIGTHFFQPVHVMKLVEIVTGLLTSKKTLDVTVDLMEKLDRIVVVVKDNGRGFPSIRLSHAIFMEAMRIVEEGVASPEDIDKILKYGYGHPMGPFELTDWIGLDMRARIWEEMYRLTNDSKWIVPTMMKMLISSGYLGNPKRKKGSKGGFYDYFKKREINR